jgi:hypothetical protein
MSLQEDLALVASAVPESIASFRERLDETWIARALQASGVATLRRRRLPAEQVIWLVLGMALMRDRRIEEVVTKLDLALPVPSGKSVAPSSIPEARERVGSKPVEWLFAETARLWAAEGADEQRWRGLAVYGVDGTSLRVPDSPENREEYGGQWAGEAKGDSGYPMVRVLALMALRTHVLAGAVVGGYGKTSEQGMARDLLRQVPDNSLTVLDRNFLSPLSLFPLTRDGSNRHWLIRTKSNTAMKTLKKLGEGDELVELKVSKEAREKDPSLPRTCTARAIRYQRNGFKPQTLLTSLLDSVQYPAAELIEMYHERWELELGFDEVKTELLEREEAIRSKKPDNVLQEVWGILLAYNLVRLEIARVAKQVDLPPTRISFVLALSLIRDEWIWSTISNSPGAIPKHLLRLRQNLQRLVLPPRRSERVYPRAVKVKMSNYARKRPTPPANRPPQEKPGA